MEQSDIKLYRDRLKSIIVLWEKWFVSENKRKPQKHDMKGAPKEIREAYIEYYHLKFPTTNENTNKSNSHEFINKIVKIRRSNSFKRNNASDNFDIDGEKENILNGYSKKLHKFFEENSQSLDAFDSQKPINNTLPKLDNYPVSIQSNISFDIKDDLYTNYASIFSDNLIQTNNYSVFDSTNNLVERKIPLFRAKIGAFITSCNSVLNDLTNNKPSDIFRSNTDDSYSPQKYEKNTQLSNSFTDNNNDNNLCNVFNKSELPEMKKPKSILCELLDLSNQHKSTITLESTRHVGNDPNKYTNEAQAMINTVSPPPDINMQSIDNEKIEGRKKRISIRKMPENYARIDLKHKNFVKKRSKRISIAKYRLDRSKNNIRWKNNKFR